MYIEHSLIIFLLAFSFLNNEKEMIKHPVNFERKKKFV